MYAKNRTIRWLCVGVAAISTAAVTAAPSNASPGGAGNGEDRLNTATARHLQDRLPNAHLARREQRGSVTHSLYTLTATQVADQVKGWRPDAAEKSLLRRTADREMRTGQLGAAADLELVAFEIPRVAPVYVVQPKGTRPGVIKAEVIEHPDGVSLNLGMETGESPESATASSSGFDAATVHGSVVNRGRGTRTIYWNPSYSSNVDHWVTTTYEKFQGTRQPTWWAYNRYATFDAANGTSGWRGEITDATIRSRPWLGLESRVNGGPYSYAPRPGETCSSTFTATINIGSYGSITAPLTSCNASLDIWPNGTKHSMGVSQYGDTTAQRYVDFSFNFTTPSSSTVPVYSDYAYMRVEYCWDPLNIACASYNPHQEVAWNDGGW